MYKDRRDDNFKKNKRNFEKRDFDRRDFDDRDDFRKEDSQPDKDIIFGRNSVTEAIKAERPLDSILVARGEHTGSIPKILSDAKKADIPVKEVDRKKLDFMCGHANHQGIIAVGAVKAYSTVDDIFARAEEKGESPFVILLDEITDPHNLGSILRTANAVGAHGVIIPKRRSVGLSSVVAKTSAGALEYTPVARVTNLAQTIDFLKEKGVWFSELLELQEQISRRRNASLVGKEVTLLCDEVAGEGLLSGKALNATEVLFQGAPSLVGKTVKVKIEKFTNVLEGKIIEE